MSPFQNNRLWNRLEYALFVFAAVFCVSCDPAGTPLALDPSVLAGKIICIDPGHQENQNPEPEPIAPGVSVQKPKVSPGAVGITTKTPEYAVNLAAGLKLRALLESCGASVVMTRTTNDVNVSNIERARIGNDAQADMMIRIHADGSEDPSANGVSVLVPSGTYIKNAALLDKSGRAGDYVLGRVAVNTGAHNRGVAERSDLSGFNWSEIPVILVEMGFLSNPREDRLLNDSDYQNKIAVGIYEGLVAYFMSY